VLHNTLTGGAGNDTYGFDADSPQHLDTIVDAGGGTDTLDFSSTTTLGVTVNLADPLAQTVNANLSLMLLAGNTLNNVVGTALDDSLTGNSLNNTLTGGAGGDVYAFDTDSTLGSDTIDESGGGLDSLYFGATTTQVVSVDLGVGGAQPVNANLNLTLSSGDTVENVAGGCWTTCYSATSTATRSAAGRGAMTTCSATRASTSCRGAPTATS
jgi:hypothetical protein